MNYLYIPTRMAKLKKKKGGGEMIPNVDEDV